MGNKIIAGNWKMFKTNSEARQLVNKFRKLLDKEPAQKSKVVVCPPYTAISTVSERLKGSDIAVGGQNLFWEEEGAYTGEISAKMLKGAGAKWVIIGHSERRRYFKEDENIINKKIKVALKNKLRVIFCVGETLEEREQNLTKDIVGNQVEWGLKGFSETELKKVVTAYEPVWAIGTGKTATPEQAQEVHAFIRDILGTLFKKSVGKNMSILYGGSVKPKNAEGLLSKDDIDGALVGGACLEAESFHQIIKAGEKVF